MATESCAGLVSGWPRARGALLWRGRLELADVDACIEHLGLLGVLVLRDDDRQQGLFRPLLLGEQAECATAACVAGLVADAAQLVLGGATHVGALPAAGLHTLGRVEAAYLVGRLAGAVGDV